MITPPQHRSTSEPPSLGSSQARPESVSARELHGRLGGGPASRPQGRLSVMLYGLNYEPELTGIGKYSGEMTRWLAERGHEVQVVTAPPYYPEWAVREGYDAWRYTTDTTLAQPGLSVLRCPLWVPRTVNGKTRIIHLMSFALTSGPALLWMTLKKRPSVILLVIPTLACAPGALLVGKLTNTPVWLHVQDFEVDAMHAMGMAATGWRGRRVAVAIESWLMSKFKRVSSISPNMVKRLGSKGVKPAQAVEFPNWVDVSTICPQPSGQLDNPVRKKLNLPADALVVLYAGNIGQKQGIEIVLDAARALADHPRLHFVMVGAGAAVENLKLYAQNLPNVQWLPLQPFELLNDLLNLADIHVLPQRADAADLVMPSKLTGMLASGRAVVGTADLNTQLGSVLQSCGVRVPPGDTDGLVQALIDLANEPQTRYALGRKGRQYALDNMSHTAVLTAFENQLIQAARVTTS
jgi:colanic acid biosynthesis glycosyl transferase WcaI